MVKCGPKLKQFSARQLRNLVREDRKAKALQRSARPPPTPPSSPRVKKRVYTRPTQYNVSLSRKKQAKAKQRLATVRKARTESSLTFSAITEDIPLFDIIKRSSDLVYTPQAPALLVYPTTPPMGNTSTNDASESGICASLNPGSNDVSPNTPNDEMEHLATPKPSLHAFQVLSSSPCDLGISDQVVECRPTLDGPSQNALGLDAVHTPSRVQDVVLHTPTVDNPPSPSIPPSKDARHVGDLIPSQVLSQLPIEEPDLVVSPRVMLPKRLSLSPRRRDSLYSVMDSPETSYHRSLMSSIWAPKPADLSRDRKQLDLRDALHVHHPNRDIDIKSEQVSVQERGGLVVETDHHFAQGEDLVGNPNPLSSNSLTQDRLDTTLIPQSTMPEFALAKNAADDFRSNRRVLDGHKNRHSLGANSTSGAFVNAVLRQTGHLRERGTVPERLPRDNRMSKPVLYDSPVLGSAPKTKKDGFGIHPTLETSRLFNTLRFQSIRNESLQSRAPTASACQLRSDPPTLPRLAPAATIRDDPLRRPSVRPTRKRLIPVGRVITYNTTSLDEARGHERQISNDASRPDTASMPVAQETAQVKPEDSWRQGIPSANWAATRTRSKRHWAKRVVADDICHHVPMENLASPPAVAPDFNITYDAQSSFGSIPQTGGSIKQRITMTLRAVYNRLWA